MESAEFWRSLFENWPSRIEKRGMIISKQGESVGFDNFLVSPGILLAERNAPDASGARKAFISYDMIAIVKLPTTMELREFQQMGFRQPTGGSASSPTGTALR